MAYLACDSFTSQWQSKVFKQYGVDQYQMMLGVNFWSLFFTGLSLIQSGEGYESLVFLADDPLALYHQVILSITSAVGQLFIFYTIKELGPVIFTIMMTTRQVDSPPDETKHLKSLLICFLSFSSPQDFLFVSFLYIVCPSIELDVNTWSYDSVRHCFLQNQEERSRLRWTRLDGCIAKVS